MAIAGNESQFKRSYKTKWKWPKLNFDRGGPKLKVGDVCNLPYDVSPQHAAMLLWRNGGVPSSAWYEDKNHQIQVGEFLSVGTGEFWDLSNAILRFRDYIPRFSVPVATVHEAYGDIALLLMFPDRDEKLWYYTWFHEEVPDNPNDPEQLIEMSPTLKKFVDKLRDSPRRNLTQSNG